MNDEIITCPTCGGSGLDPVETVGIHDGWHSPNDPDVCGMCSGCGWLFSECLADYYLCDRCDCETSEENLVLDDGELICFNCFDRQNRTTAVSADPGVTVTVTGRTV